MANQPYIVIRLVPESPVDGATFATYLDGLALQVFDAYTDAPRSDLAYSSPMVLTQWAGGRFISAVSAPTAKSTDNVSANDYGSTLTFNSTNGISVGSFVFSADKKTIDPGSNLTVTEVSEAGTVVLNNELSNYVPAGTAVYFLSLSPSQDPMSAPGYHFSLPTSSPATAIGDELLVLHFDDASGVTIGMTASGSFIASGTTVAEVEPTGAGKPTDVTVSQKLGGSPSSVTFAMKAPYAYFDLTPKTGSPDTAPTTLTFDPDQTKGVAVGMTLSPGQGQGLVAPGTTVTYVSDNTGVVTLSKALLGPLSGQAVTFTFPLSSGIIQHAESIFELAGIPDLSNAVIPASVATAVIPLNPSPPLPDYLDITIKATRNSETIPISKIFYNVKVSTADLPRTPDQYQAISNDDTSLYISLPPQPGTNPISLQMPGDGSAPSFDSLYKAIETALANDPIPGTEVSSLIASPTQCARIAYDIAWSFQNNLPAPPDPLEFLYTNPPNPGGGGGNASGTGSNSNNFEQDRQKFEGTLSSFYSTRNATAERLTKFVAAASAAVACEEASINSAAALLEFPVDPSAAFATAVSSELLVDGLGTTGPSGINFGVPAAFFYALGAHLDKSTSVAHRFQMATGEAFERLQQQLAAAENAGVIKDTESFADTSLGPQAITSFQAARRLVALRASAASTSPAVTAFPGSPLASLIKAWLAATEPSPQNPPLTAQNTDFNIWTQQLAVSGPSGYVDLDLDALTQGFIIPPFSASPSADVSSGATLTFGAGAGIGAGMPVSGPNIAPGTTVAAVSATITLSAAVAADVPSGSAITVGPVTFTTVSDCPAGTAVLTVGPGAANGINAGMPASGPGIAAGSTVQAVVPTVVTLSEYVTGTVTTAAVLVFNFAMPPFTATTTAECAVGTTLLTLGAGDGDHISVGMAVFGTNIAPGATVQHATADTVTLSTGVTADVPSTSDITFVVIPVAPIAPITATTTQKCPAGVTLTFASGATGEISAGMSVSGPGIAADTTVLNVTDTVTLSTGVAADVPSGSNITFGPITATTTADCAAGVTLTFGPGGTNGIGAGMPVFGPGIAPGTTVQSVAATTVTLGTGVTADVPSASVITFGPIPATTIVPSLLADQIAAWLPTTTSPPTPHPTVATLKQVTATQWTNFFTVTGSPQWLPPFTQPAGPGTSPGQATQKSGYVAARIRAFVRAVHQFFTVSSVPTKAQLPAADAPPVFDVPPDDPISQAVAALGGFQFGGALAGSALSAAVQAVFPGDLTAQAWLFQAMTAINELREIVNGIPDPAPPPTASLKFSVMEALYARGFRSAADITRLSAADFRQALTGTVAYDFATSGASSLYDAAQHLAPQTPPPGQDGGAFQPVNPDGSLVDCVPPPRLSPTGPIAYLQELLGISVLSTCDAVVAAPLSLVTADQAQEGDTVVTFASAAAVSVGMSVAADQIADGTTVAAADQTTVTLSRPLTGAMPEGTSVQFTAPTLGTVLSQRRGPVGDLLASRANLETPLPLIDIVNECLEYLGSQAPPGPGAIYDTAQDALAGHALCAAGAGIAGGEAEADGCHDPGVLFAVLPEHSTPATPGAANASVEPAVFNALKTDFSSCLLPYSQALDVSRSYLSQVGSRRYDEMRTFRKCITEFVLDPAHEPVGFQPWLWRYPVRVDIAIEYLGITPEEYALLFRGAAAPPCAAPPDAPAVAPPDAPAVAPPDAPPGAAAERGTIGLPEFLAETCLSYCEFYELWQSGFVAFRNSAEEKGAFPPCEPCCPGDVRLLFPEKEQQQDVEKLRVFVALWRKLRDSCGPGYSFARLRDICDVLELYRDDALNPDFIRQLAAFQMLRDDFQMDLADSSAPGAAGAAGADRTHLLALWAGPTAAKWPWAVHQLITRVEQYAAMDDGERRPAEFSRLLLANLDPLSRLAGFDPASASDSWHARPTHTLRFAEVLAKILASGFGVGELIYLFTADPHLDGDDPFPLQEDNEAQDLPLGLPDDSGAHALWRLRQELLEVSVPEEETERWPWRRIEAALHAEFGFATADILALGQHFFPGVLARSGHHYDPAAEQLSAGVPLTDRAIITTLTRVHDLDQAERRAVQDLYFQPRAVLAAFALLFGNFATAQRRLIEEDDEDERFTFFRHEFLLCRHRCRVIARHLSRHVEAVTGRDTPAEGGEDEDGAGEAAAALILRALAADENTAATSWEDDSGAMPALTWALPSGSALAALLGLTGTGLVAEYRPADGELAWRDGSGSLSGFGAERDRENCPVPTVLPSLAATLSPEQLRFASAHNGFLMADATGAWLGGAQGFTVTWSGVLLVEREGSYEFWAGAPAPGEDRPDPEAAGHCRWRVTLRRGQRGWVILSHHWADEEERRSAALPLKRGGYDVTVEFIQPAPELCDGDVRRQHTGFQVKYSGPDSAGRRTEIPHSRLFARQKDQTLAAGIDGLGQGAAAYLETLYLSSLRDIRRTYQRAFKALLFTHRFGLSARRRPHGTTELGYLLAQASRFAGVGYYRADGGFTRHAADFAFDFLPLRDQYHAPADDARTAPSPQRVQAMFDWWERMADYTAARAEVQRRCGRLLWHLFEEAQEKQPADPGYLLRHIDADARHWALDLRYFQGQDVPPYTVNSTDLEDDRWTLRAWHADRWLRGLHRRFTAKDITVARPDLWAADDPSAGLPDSGNANLVALVADGCLENGGPRRYEDLKRLNDGLRGRGRDALVAYLCHGNRVELPWQPGQFAASPRDLSDVLLVDVKAGLRERACRIEEAITAAQSFIRRARLGLEPGWPVNREFARLWDSRFETYRIWERRRRRELYRESWIEWEDLAKARRIEAFRFLESQLHASTLTVAAPGGLDWWADDAADDEDAPELLQRRVPAELHPLAPFKGSASREGFTVLGTPEHAPAPTWLTTAPPDGGQAANDARNAGELVRAAVAGGTQPPQVPLWMESAMKLGTRFIRVAAAGVPQAALGFVPPGDEPRGACCRECGRDHPVLVDEYYFWLVDTRLYAYTDDTDAQSNGDANFRGSYQLGFQDSYYDQSQQQSAEWNDEDQVPALLAKWQPGPAVRLAWCRVHNGEFGQPRKSAECVAVDESPDLVLLGRAADSLYFTVTGSAPPPAGYGADPPGFRYDLPDDQAIALPQVLEPPAPAAADPGGLPSYPFFAYHEPGARLFPGSWFSASLAVGDALRARCLFELALRWYRRPFDPLKQDCAWVRCSDSDSTAVTDDGVRNRAVTLRYCQTLVDWGDALMRQRRSPEAFQQARLLYDTAARIMGPRPRTIALHDPVTPQQVATFTPAYAPLNPRLMELYDLVADRLGLIRRSIDARRLRNGRPGRDMRYFGDGPLAERPGAAEPCGEDDRCDKPSPYRFQAQMQKATEIAGRVRELGAALLSAYEKGDAEYLASVHAEQERELLALGVAIRQDQWRDADWQVQALQQTKDVNQTSLLYYTNLNQLGLINDEIQHLTLTTNALQTRTGANQTEVIGEIFNIIPDFFVGAMSTFSQIPIGTKLAGLFQAIAKGMQTTADIQGTTAGVNGTQAGWQRRSDEWVQHIQTLPIEIRQTELLILGAHRKRDQAMRELNNHHRQVENATEVQDFLRDKFTATELYLWLQKETAALHSRMYELALQSAREAERAFNFERGHTNRRFIPEETWDTLHAGLMAGERLEFALRQMEKAYMDENRRELELTKHVSLRLDFPAAYLRLRTTGYCEISIPEWMFDLDYPGHYMRRISNVRLTAPVVTSPFTGVHARLTLLSSTTRIHPETQPPAGHCCPDDTERSGYAACHDDPRVVRDYAARESIATSSGQNDPGLFELNFRDERYLPFEYLGAVSRWRIELPPENNYFDLDTLTDLVLHLSYTAREGGDALRATAAADARHRLPGDGLRLFDVRHDFPDAWPALRQPGHEPPRDGGGRHRRLRLSFTPAMFPFVPGKRVGAIGRLLLMFAAPDAVPGHHHQVRFRRDGADRAGPYHEESGHGEAAEFECVANEAWPGYFCGTIDLREHPIALSHDGRPTACTFEIPVHAGEVRSVFVIAHYDVRDGRPRFGRPAED